MDPCRILVVEDEALVAMDIEERLIAMGYHPVGRTRSGEDALALVESIRPDLVLMDIRLQGEMDGITAAEQIHRCHQKPVIFLTAYSEDTTLERAKLAESYGYVLKPFDDRELKSAIEIALHKHGADVQIRRANRLYDVLSHVNQAVVRVRSREELLPTVCRLLVERGQVDLAWIGRLDPRTARITPVAYFGGPTEILSESEFYADSRSEGQGNPGRAVREGRPFVCNACAAGDCLYPAVHAPARHGFQSCGSFPIRFQGELWGALSLCVKEAGFFEERELRLLEEVALDVSFALDRIEGDARRERAEENLRKSESFLSTIFHASPVSIAITRLRDGRIIDVNKAWLELTGLSREEAIDHSPTELNCWVDPAHRGELVRRLLERRTVQDFECRFRHISGRVVDLLLSAELIELPGEPCMLSLAQDVTHRKREEEELRRRLELQDQLAKIAASVPGVVHSFRLRPDGTACMPFTTPAVEDLFGIPQAVLAEDVSPWAANVHPEDLERVNAAVAEAARGPRPWHDVYRYRHPTKGLRWIEGWSLPQADSDGSILWHGFVMDITERKQAEERQEGLEAQLRQAQKMEALGTLAGGIAHDFNNILGIIFGYAEIARAAQGDAQLLGESLGQILSVSHRAKDLVQQILAFSRQGEQELRPVQVGLIVKEALKMLRASLPTTIAIQHEVTARSSVWADPTQIHQVLMNLCTNSAHAMGDEGGLLTVTLKDVLLEPESIPPHWELQPGPHVELTVTDTGHGIGEDILDRIFDPFFTTKGRGVGTGLGLSVVHGIVKRHGGAISVESQEGKGASFRVLLPAAERLEAAPEPNPDSLPTGRERVLVVDDEPQLAAAMKKMLERLGYRVETRTAGGEALDAIRHQPDEHPFDLVITDMTMPGLSGRDLARELHRLRPGLPVILCTGFSEKIDAEGARAAGCRAFLMKPIALRDLAPVVRKVLDGEGRSSGC